MTKNIISCDCCNNRDRKVKYYSEYNSALCDSCSSMYKRYPFKYIPPKGEIHYDEDGNIICHECGRAFKKLNLHIRTKHQLTNEEYKKKNGLNRTSNLTGKSFISNITVDVRTINKNTQFSKNHDKNKNKSRRLQFEKSKKAS